MKPWLIGVLICLAVSAAAAQKYGVTVTADKNVDFAKFKSYTWKKGQPAPLKSVDEQIVSAVERELQGLGMTKAATGTGDVLVTYASLQRSDVNLKAKKDANGILPQYPVGTLVVDLLDPATQRQLLRLRLDKPLNADPSKLESAINSAVAELFANYPTRQKKR